MGASDNQPRMQIQQRVFADETESYLQSRSDAVQSIESTIVELGGIFQQLAVMVREQEEMVQRYVAIIFLIKKSHILYYFLFFLHSQD
jgi:syntaxin 5